MAMRKFFFRGEDFKMMGEPRHKVYTSALETMGIIYKLEKKGKDFYIEFESTKKGFDKVVNRIVHPSKQ